MLSGERVALTGSIDGVSRTSFKDRVREAGGAYSAVIEEGVGILVVGEGALSSKIEQARSLGIEVLEPNTFEARIQQGPTDDTEVPLAFETAEDAPLATAELDGAVRILDVSLPRVEPGPLTPDLVLFEHYTLDAPTLALLRFLVGAVRLRQPCLIEGDTATSKTSAIQYLAARTGHQLVRINLNGQTDTSELVGRYIPNEAGVNLDVDDLLAHADLLEPESQEILARVAEEGRDLSAVEAQQIAANEKMPTPQWRFQEGLIPRAMRQGWWVILDEVNLAEPQVLERLNPVLERVPTLVLTEGSGTRFGPGGDVPVHEDFRVFGTMNPAEYQGRSVLSPAWRDRWVATWQSDPPGELEYRQMLERLVFGRQPDVEVRGFYRGDAGPAPYADLASVPGIGGLLAKLAALHAALVTMASPGDGSGPSLGVGRRERYVFTRRGLLGVLDGLLRSRLCDPVSGEEVGFAEAPETIASDVIEHYCLDRIRGEDDRARVINLLRSLGLHRSSWLHAFEEADSP